MTSLEIHQILQRLETPTPQALLEAETLLGSVEYCLAKWRQFDGCPPEELEGLLTQIRSKIRSKSNDEHSVTR